jgi:hypothetical protein
MASNDDSKARLRLAVRILFQTLRQAPPVTLNEIAQLQFLAESDEEREMPPDRLARRVIERESESKRMGMPPFNPRLPRFDPN